MKEVYLKVYQASNLKTLDFIDHGFFTRNGGVSKENFRSLNTYHFTKDNPTDIEENRKIVTQYFNKNKHNLITLHQQSQAEVIVVTKNNIPQYTYKADALITKEKGLILGIFTADCVPILLADPITKTVAAIHAGHNGAFNGIIENTITELKKLQILPSNLIASIGPAITMENYEVQKEFYLKYTNKEASNKKFFTIYNNCYFFSLQSYIINKLNQIGIKNIEDLSLDTYSNPSLFFSHRYSLKNNIDRGAQISTIVIKE